MTVESSRDFFGRKVEGCGSRARGAWLRSDGVSRDDPHRLTNPEELASDAERLTAGFPRETTELGCITVRPEARPQASCPSAELGWCSCGVRPQGSVSTSGARFDRPRGHSRALRQIPWPHPFAAPWPGIKRPSAARVQCEHERPNFLLCPHQNNCH
jgi:hypothetical protein